MKTINDIAAAAYAAHAKELRRLIGVNDRPWADLPRTEVLCWEQAARQVLAEAATMGLDLEKAAPVIDMASVKGPRLGTSWPELVAA